LVVRSAPAISITDSDAPFELVLRSGVVVRVPSSFEAAALERLLEVLRSSAC
jgi:hypothetical protein